MVSHQPPQPLCYFRIYAKDVLFRHLNLISLILLSVVVFCFLCVANK